MSKGHGEYREIPSEKDFFAEVKESKSVVCHFYRDSTFRYLRTFYYYYIILVLWIINQMCKQIFSVFNLFPKDAKFWTSI